MEISEGKTESGPAGGAIEPSFVTSRAVLSLSSGVRVRPGETAVITSTPRRAAFRPERFFVSGFTPRLPWYRRWLSWRQLTHGARDWTIKDILIDGRSQFSQRGAIPGDLFNDLAISSFVSFDTVQIGMEVTVLATYCGARKQGVPLYASMIGVTVQHAANGSDAAIS